MTTPHSLRDAYAMIVHQAIHTVILPSFSNFDRATKALVIATEISDNDIQVEECFRNLAIIWGRTQHLRIGPARKGTLYERISFGADPRSYVARKINSLIAANDQDVLSSDKLHNKSIAIQGITAFDHLQNGFFEPTTYEYRTELKISIARNLAFISQTILDDWTDRNGFIEQINHPGPDNALFQSWNEAAMEIFKPLVGFLRFFIDVKVSDPMQSSIEFARPRYVEYWRSELSKDVLINNISALHTYYEKSGIAFLVGTRSASLHDQVEADFGSSIRALQSIRPPIHKAITLKESRLQLSYLVTTLNNLWVNLAINVAELLHLQVGFNEFDGD